MRRRDVQVDYGTIKLWDIGLLHLSTPPDEKEKTVVGKRGGLMKLNALGDIFAELLRN
jgi:hypothetical protein